MAIGSSVLLRRPINCETDFVGVDHLVQVDFRLTAFVQTSNQVGKLLREGMVEHIPAVGQHGGDGREIGLACQKVRV